MRVDDLAAWYRDLVVAANGAEQTVVDSDRLVQPRDHVAGPAGQGAEEAAAVVRQAWRELEELNLEPAPLPRGALRPTAARVLVT